MQLEPLTEHAAVALTLLLRCPMEKHDLGEEVEGDGLQSGAPGQGRLGEGGLLHGPGPALGRAASPCVAPDHTPENAVEELEETRSSPSESPFLLVQLFQHNGRLFIIIYKSFVYVGIAFLMKYYFVFFKHGFGRIYSVIIFDSYEIGGD